MALGPQFNQFTEMVPINALLPLRSNELDYDVSDLSKDIKERGVQQPVVVIYGKNDRRAMLGEGHHRLEASRQAGLTHVPTTAFRHQNIDGQGVPVRGYQGQGHVPADLKPSDVMDWEDE